ncbi:MAG: GNAT family N-acetyltransferase [Ferruginibacter sp.]
MPYSDILFRHIIRADNPFLAGIIRTSLKDYNAVRPDTVYDDPTTDDLYNLFLTDRSIYFVLEDDQGKVRGGGGIFPTPGLPEKTCELVKIYFQKEIRGKGYGRKLLELCEKSAAAMGYRHIYLESMPELTNALPLYEKMGYYYIPYSLGKSGHTGCSVFMQKDLD